MARKLSKKRKRLLEAIDSKKAYLVLEAVGVLKACASSKFDEAVELAVNLGVDPRHADQQVRGTVQLPHGTGRKIRVAVFARGERAEEARKAGADMVGAEDLIEKVQAGELGFDRTIATPDMMGLVGRLGKILGPRNLMPNPRLGTVTPKIAEAVTAAKGGQIQFRAEKGGIVHAAVGRMSFSEEHIEANIRSFVGALLSAKPSGAKEHYVKSVALSSTQGGGIHLDLGDALKKNRGSDAETRQA